MTMKRKPDDIQEAIPSKLLKLEGSFGATFRRKLKTDDALNALKEFVSTNKKRNVVDEYINAGGSVKELLGVLQRFDVKNDFSIANTIFSAIYFIVEKVVDDLLLVEETTEKACEELLSNYFTTMLSMLSTSSSSTSHRKVILKLFTAVVRFNGNLAKKILSSFPTYPKLLRILTESSSSKSNKLRICFINFCLAFLIDNNTALSLELLEKKGLFYNIISGLMNDSPETVILVLNTLRWKVVENIKISKTSKLHIFNTSVLRLIAKLFDYDSNVEMELEDPEDVNYVSLVRQAVYELLLLLCTSHKNGVLFREQHNSMGKNKNELILTLLEDITNPHLDDLKSNLLAEILKVCPEFVKNTLAKLESNLYPCASENWIRAINFVILVIEKQELSVYYDNERHAFTAVCSVVFPSIIQRCFSRDFNDDVIHTNPVIRFQAIRLLLTIMRKVSEILNKYVDSVGNNLHSATSFRDQVELFLNKSVIPPKKLFNAWKVGVNFTSQENVDNCNDTQLTSNEYYLALIDLLLLYKILIPECFNELRTNENVNFYDEAVAVDNAELKFKLARLIFYIHNPRPSETQFVFMMKQFIEYYISNEDSELHAIVQDVLRTTGFFDGFESEVNVWFYCMKKDQRCAVVISDLFVETLNISATKNKNFVKLLANLGKDLASKKSFHLSDEDDNENLPIGDFFDVNEMLDMMTKPGVTLSPMVPAFLYVLSHKYGSPKQDDEHFEMVQNFAGTIFVHLLHLQCTAQPIIALFEKYPSKYINKKISDFISFWNKETSGEEFPDYPLELEKAAENCYLNLFSGNSLSEALESINDTTEAEAVSLWNLCIFYTTRLHEMNLLQNDQKVESVAMIFKQLLQKMRPENTSSCLKLILMNQFFIDSFEIERSKKSSLLPNILLDVILDLKGDKGLLLPNITSLVSPYRYKFFSTIMNRIKKGKNLQIHLRNVSMKNLIQFVEMPNNMVVFLLNELIQLPVKVFTRHQPKPNADEISACTLQLIKVVECLLEETAVYLETPLENENLIQLISKLIDMYKMKIVAQDLEASIVHYIQAFPHHICRIPEDLILNLIHQHPKTSISKLALYLIPHRLSLPRSLQETIVKNIAELDIGSLLEVLNKIEFPEDLEQKVLKHLRKFYFRSVTQLLDDEESPWLSCANRIWTEKIIAEFDEASRVKACEDIEKEWTRITLNVNKCMIMKIFFEKSSKLEIFISLLIRKFDRMILTNNNIDWICTVIHDITQTIEDLTSLPKSSFWKEFIRLSLKFGLQADHSAIMSNFRMICEKSLCSDAEGNTSLIFQMTISHSEFVNRMMNNANVKCELIELLLVLTKFDTAVMSSNHLPVLLASYKATLSKSDQLLLQLLHWYEENGIRFSDCRPYLWGEGAASHHSIQTDISVSLKRQPLPNQVLGLLDMNIIKNTIKYFPLDRRLLLDSGFSSTSYEVYDLSFMLPLLSHLLAPESRISVQKFTRSGALCLILTSLSCEDENIRKAAYHCLNRFHDHLFSREKEIQIWNQFINALRSGLVADFSPENGEKPPRLSCLVTTFLSYMSLIIGEPLHPLYSPLLNFLLAKPYFELSCIPNFFMLFYSADLKHKEHQEWILKMIRDGMRFEKDWIVAQKSYLFKFLQQYYFSSLSNERVNLLILEILKKSLEIDKCRLVLITKCGLLSWISQILQTIDRDHTNYLPSITSILKLLISTKNAKRLLLMASVMIRKLMNFGVSEINLADLLQIICDTYCICKKNDVLQEDSITLVIKFSSPLIDSRSRKVFENCLKYKSVVGLEEYRHSNANTCIIRILYKFIDDK